MMKIEGISGIFNYAAFNPLKNDSKGPQPLEVVYKNEIGKLYLQYLNSGDFPLLISRLNSMKDNKEKELEIEKYINEGKVEAIGYRYRPIKNKFFYSGIKIDENFISSYASLKDYPQDKIEIDSFALTNPYNQAVQVENKKIFIGTFQYIFEKVKPYLNIKGKTSQEIMAIINWLIENLYLEEAFSIINNVKSNSTNLDEYRHPKNLFVTDGTTNFLDSSLNEIENLYFVKEHTKSLNLKIFHGR